jgi:hypothetical protein
MPYDVQDWCKVARFWCVRAHLKRSIFACASFVPVGDIRVCKSLSMAIDHILKIGDARPLRVAQLACAWAFGSPGLRQAARQIRRA